MAEAEWEPEEDLSVDLGGELPGRHGAQYVPRTVELNDEAEDDLGAPVEDTSDVVIGALRPSKVAPGSATQDVMQEGLGNSRASAGAGPDASAGQSILERMLAEGEQQGAEDKLTEPNGPQQPSNAATSPPAVPTRGQTSGLTPDLEQALLDPTNPRHDEAQRAMAVLDEMRQLFESMDTSMTVGEAVQNGETDTILQGHFPELLEQASGAIAERPETSMKLTNQDGNDWVVRGVAMPAGFWRRMAAIAAEHAAHCPHGESCGGHYPSGVVSQTLHQYWVTPEDYELPVMIQMAIRVISSAAAAMSNNGPITEASELSQLMAMANQAIGGIPVDVMREGFVGQVISRLVENGTIVVAPDVLNTVSFSTNLAPEEMQRQIDKLRSEHGQSESSAALDDMLDHFGTDEGSEDDE